MFKFQAGKSVFAHILLASTLTLGGQFTAQARSPVAAESGSEFWSSVALAELPPQGRDTYDRILQGGPFPHEKDGTVFGNRERQLPIERRGYYREYTVRTPGSRDRGARRIVCGGVPVRPTACFYTDDHYATFRRIVP